MSEEVHKAPKLCGVCQKGFLIPSGCGCNNAACTNYVEKWKPATTGYEPPRKVEPPKVPAPAPTKAPEPAPVAAAPAETGEPLKKKRGRPKKNP